MTDSKDDRSTTLDDDEKACDMTESNVSDEESLLTPVDWRETLPAIEFCCWVVVVLAPLLRWVNGPAVTDDQALIQTVLFSLALLAAISLRQFDSRRAKRAQPKNIDAAER